MIRTTKKSVTKEIYEKKNERNLKVWEISKKMQGRSMQMKEGTKKVYDVNIKKPRVIRKYREPIRE